MVPVAIPSTQDANGHGRIRTGLGVSDQKVRQTSKARLTPRVINRLDEPGVTGESWSMSVSFPSRSVRRALGCLALLDPGHAIATATAAAA